MLDFIKICNKQDLNRFLLRVTEYPTFHITCHRVPYLSHCMSQCTLRCDSIDPTRGVHCDKRSISKYQYFCKIFLKIYFLSHLQTKFIILSIE